jgi:RNA polymerase sigma-70 factor, ECF subfamily
MTESNAIDPSGVYGAMHAQMPTTFGSGGGPAPPAEAAEPAPEPYVSDHAPEAATDQAGFSAFYRDAWPSVARALAIALGDRDLAVDATDEAMARAYPRWGRLRGYDNPAGWVYRVGLNWARSHHRRMSRRHTLERAEPIPPPVSDPEVRTALMALPLKLRSVVVCRLLLDWSVADTAKALGVRPGTVQSRLHRAVQTLEVSLEHLR